MKIAYHYNKTALKSILFVHFLWKRNAEETDIKYLSELTKKLMKFYGKAVTKYKTVNWLDIELLLSKWYLI